MSNVIVTPAVPYIYRSEPNCEPGFLRPYGVAGPGAEKLRGSRYTLEEAAEALAELLSPGSRPVERLTWAHIDTAFVWADGPACLRWASRNKATVVEMRAYWRPSHGEDLSVPKTED